MKLKEDDYRTLIAIEARRLAESMPYQFVWCTDDMKKKLRRIEEMLDEIKKLRQ